jgi:tetratricopeptide (TPR) repeat protein
MKLIYLLPIASLIVLQPTIANALSPAEVQSIAKSVTLKIEASGGEKPDAGSGVIIQKQGNNYILATNAHVVCGNEKGYLIKCSKHTKYSIITPDGKSHSATDTAVKLLPNLDLAIVEFQSDRNYPVATLGNSDKIKIDAPIYAAGFPSKKGFNFNSGSIVASGKTRLEGDNGGYTVIYDAATNPGMSGGGVFDRQGQLIAIHGRGDYYRQNTETIISYEQIRQDLNANWGDFYNVSVGQKIGLNRGIPINYIRRQISAIGNVSNDRTILNPTTADDWFITAVNKALYPQSKQLTQDKQAAVQDCSKAIQLQPNYLMAYYLRGRLLEQLNVADRAVSDFQAVDKLQPSSFLKYVIRSDARFRIKKFDSSLADVNKAIEIDKTYPAAYTLRAALSLQNKKASMAIADLDRAIDLDSNNSITYLYRAMTKFTISDLKGAVADLKSAINIRENNGESTQIYRSYLSLLTQSQTGSIPNSLPNEQSDSVEFYLARANQKKSKGDLQGALADYDKAVDIQPTALVLISRAIFKEKELKDIAGAEADLSRAIELRADEPYYYLLRVNVRKTNNNRKGAIADLEQAAKIYKQRGDQKNYALMQQFIQYFPSN